MREIRQKIISILKEYIDPEKRKGYEEFIVEVETCAAEIIDVIEAYFQQIGKQGGDSTKKKADYSAIGKKGAEKRWKKS